MAVSSKSKQNSLFFFLFYMYKHSTLYPICLGGVLRLQFQLDKVLTQYILLEEYLRICVNQTLHKHFVFYNYNVTSSFQDSPVSYILWNIRYASPHIIVTLRTPRNGERKYGYDDNDVNADTQKYFSLSNFQISPKTNICLMTKSNVFSWNIVCASDF